MIKNRVTQLIVQTIYCTLGLVAIFASLGVFEAKFYNEFYIYFTNISNYICIIIMFLELCQTIKYANKNEDGYCSFCPVLKFTGLIIIILTFLVFNVLLAKDMTLQQNLSITSILFHIILPILYVLDWFLFYEPNKTKWYYPFISLVVPILYFIFILIRASLIKNDQATLYPYFFFNIDDLGIGGILKWNIIICIAISFIGYILVFINHLGKRKKSN